MELVAPIARPMSVARTKPGYPARVQSLVGFGKRDELISKLFVDCARSRLLAGVVAVMRSGEGCGLGDAAACFETPFAGSFGDADTWARQRDALRLDALESLLDEHCSCRGVVGIRLRVLDLSAAVCIGAQAFRPFGLVSVTVNALLEPAIECRLAPCA